jgi:polysaccharide export outer membrane protein
MGRVLPAVRRIGRECAHIKGFAAKIAWLRSICVTWLFTGLVSILCAGCQGSGTGASLQEREAPPSSVILSSGDVVKLSFSGAPELNQSQKIRVDGKINLPLVGEVDAAGKTIGTLQEDLASRYKPQLKNTTIVVTLESATSRVVVSGAVNKPRTLSFDRPTTVFQAIMEAGGVNQYGNLRKVRLFRVTNGEQHTEVLNLKSTMSGHTTRAYYVRDGDIIFVPQSAF